MIDNMEVDVAHKDDGQDVGVTEQRSLKSSADGKDTVKTEGTSEEAGADEEERKRRALEKMEKEFSDLKEKWFADRITSIKKEMEMVGQGTHGKFVQRLKELEVKREDKIATADQWRQFQIQNLNNVFNSDKKQAEDEYDLEVQQLKDKMTTTLSEKMKKLEQDKTTMSLSDITTEMSRQQSKNDAAQSVPRTLRRRGAAKEKQEQQDKLSRKKLNPPHIVYQLKDSEIVDDLTAMQKTYSAPGSRGDSRAKIWEVYVDKDASHNGGILHYYSKTFEKGNTIVIDNEGKETSGIIASVNPQEIIMRSGDGAKMKISITSLRSGKYTILVP